MPVGPGPFAMTFDPFKFEDAALQRAGPARRAPARGPRPQEGLPVRLRGHLHPVVRAGHRPRRLHRPGRHLLQRGLQPGRAADPEGPGRDDVAAAGRSSLAPARVRSSPPWLGSPTAATSPRPTSCSQTPVQHPGAHVPASQEDGRRLPCWRTTSIGNPLEAATQLARLVPTRAIALRCPLGGDGTTMQRTCLYAVVTQTTPGTLAVGRPHERRDRRRGPRDAGGQLHPGGRPPDGRRRLARRRDDLRDERRARQAGHLRHRRPAPPGRLDRHPVEPAAHAPRAPGLRPAAAARTALLRS